MLAVRPARFADAVALAASLRVEDALELSAAWPVPPAEGLINCLLRSDRAFAVTARDRPLALWGVTDTAVAGLELGVPWLLAAPALFRRRRELVARSRGWVARLLLDYDVLLNVTDAANAAHLRWLEWCGFEALRDWPRFGRLGRTYREFYRVNARRHKALSGVRELLLGRAAPTQAPQSEPLTRLVRLARGAFGDDPGVPSLLEDLPTLLPAIAADALPARIRNGVLALLLELTVRAGFRDSAAGPGRPAGATLGGRWCSALAAAAEAAALRDSGPGITEVLAALRARQPRPPQSREPAAREQPIPTRSSAPQGAGLLRALAEAYLRALTLDGRVDCVAGYRILRAVAGGEDDDDEFGAPGCSRRHLVAAFLPLRLSRTVEDATGMAALVEVARAPVRPGGLERLYGALPEHSPFARALAGTIEQWAPFARPVHCVADACRVAGAMADTVAGLMLPTLVVDGVSAGIAERHAVYRVVRGQLLAGAMAGDRRQLRRLLAAEVAALVTAAAFDDALLSLPGAGRKVPPGGHAAAALGRAIAQIWGPLGEQNLAAVLALLLPLLSVPAAHGRQLAPALLVWHLAETDGLGSLLSELGDVFRFPQREPGQRCRRVLRRWQRGLDIVAFRRHLEGHGNQRSADRPSDSDPAGHPGSAPPS